MEKRFGFFSSAFRNHFYRFKDLEASVKEVVVAGTDSGV